MNYKAFNVSLFKQACTLGYKLSTQENQEIIRITRKKQKEAPDSHKIFFSLFKKYLHFPIAYQVVIKESIVDFLIPDKRIVIQIGDYDLLQDDSISDYVILRFTDKELKENAGKIISYLRLITGVEQRKRELQESMIKPLPTLKKYKSYSVALEAFQ